MILIKVVPNCHREIKSTHYGLNHIEGGVEVQEDERMRKRGRPRSQVARMRKKTKTGRSEDAGTLSTLTTA